MFVVSQNTTKSQDPRTTFTSNRSAGASRQRGGAEKAAFPRLNLAPASRGDSQNVGIRTPSVESSPVAPKQEAPTNGMQKLLDTMKSLGMSASGLDMNYTEEAVGYPGGMYMNRLINITSGGKTEHFSSELTDKNPLVTATEIQRYFGVAANPGGASGFSKG